MRADGAVALLEAAISRAPAGPRRAALERRLQRIRDAFGIFPVPLERTEVIWPPDYPAQDALPSADTFSGDENQPSGMELAEQIALEWQEERLG